MSYRELDLRKVRTVPVMDRASKVTEATLAWPPVGDDTFHDFWRALPDVLAVRELREVVDKVKAAKARGKTIMWCLGGHVIKVGMGPLLWRLCREGWVSHLTLNGAAAIHDFELAFFGATSEDVAEGLADGTFGMAAETGVLFNEATLLAAQQERGLGETLSQFIVTHAAYARQYHRGTSVLAACQQYDIPVTVHPMLGAEIVHQHPTMNGEAIGKASARDFRRLAGATLGLHDGGVVLHWGSAVVLPEVFLKALTVARNLHEGRPTGFLAADFDMQRQYRPTMNVVQRPTAGHGVSITGHHELMFPLLAWALLA